MRAAENHSSACRVEALERRLFMHAGGHHHMSLAEFYEHFPDITGSPWDFANFDPNNTGDPKQFRYDPHLIEDDGTFAPAVPALDGDAEPADDPAITVALPDLIPLIGGPYLNPYIDTTEIPGRNLLRFATGIGNVGAGPALLSSSANAVDPQGRQIVTQTIYNYNSNTNAFTPAYQREAGRFIWHPSHGHFHLEGYASYRLLTRVNGQPGPVAMRADGTPAQGDKIGFCLINVLNSFTLPGGGSSTTIPGYSASGQLNTVCGFTQGVKVGRADVYESNLDGQWIDVTGVANGNYFLEVTLDATNAIEESNDANNIAIVPITLNANPPVGGIQPDRFEANNDFDHATDLNELGVETHSGLTIHTSHESDFFKFTAASSGTYSVQLLVGNRDVNLYLYDSQRNLMGASTSPALGPMTETVTATFVAGQTYYIEARGFSSDEGTSGVSSNYAVKVNVNPTVAALAPISTASAAGGAGMFRIQRNGPVSSPLTVNLSYSGSAVSGVDYDALPSSIIIGNEVSFFDVDVPIKSGAVLTGDKTLIVTITTSGGYVVGTSSATVTLLENVKPSAMGSSFHWNTPRQQVSVSFSENVGAGLLPTALQLTNLTTGQAAVPVGVDFDALTNVATFTFAGILPDGNYSGSINGSSGVTDAAGNPLANTQPVEFYVLGGDANRDRTVNALDLAILASNWQQSGRTFAYGDFSYDGVVDIADLSILTGRWQSSLAQPPEPTAIQTPRRPTVASRFGRIATQVLT